MIIIDNLLVPKIAPQVKSYKLVVLHTLIFRMKISQKNLVGEMTLLGY